MAQTPKTVNSTTAEENSKVVPLGNPATNLTEKSPNGAIGTQLHKRFGLAEKINKKAIKPNLANISFLALVMLPLLLTSVYMIGFAKDQFSAKASFVVRSNSAATASDVLGFLSQSSGDSPTADSYIIIDYLSNENFVSALSSRFDLNRIYGRDVADWYFSIGNSQNIQDTADYWTRMHEIHFDVASGMLTLEVRAFQPDHASLLAEFSLQESGRLIEKMSEEARADQVQFAKKEVALAELRLKDIRRRLNEFRNETGILDPELAITSALATINELNKQRLEVANERTTLLASLSVDSPSIRRLDDRLNALDQQITEQQSKIDGKANSQSDNNLSYQIGDYEEIAVEKGFAEKAYTAALAALEQARVKAANTQKYLSIVQNPAPRNRSDYPNRLLWIFVVGTLGLAMWSILNLVVANLRIRR